MRTGLHFGCASGGALCLGGFDDVLQAELQAAEFRVVVDLEGKQMKYEAFTDGTTYYAVFTARIKDE